MQLITHQLTLALLKTDRPWSYVIRCAEPTKRLLTISGVFSPGMTNHQGSET